MKQVLFLTSLLVLFRLNAQTVNIANADFETENLAIPTVSPGVGLGWHTNNTQNPKITGGEATTPAAGFSTLRQELNFPTAGFYSFSIDIKSDASPLLKNLYITMRNPEGNGLNPIWVLDSGTDNVYIPPAPGDAGGALGSAAYIINKKKNIKFDDNPYLGPSFSSDYIKKILKKATPISGKLSNQ